MFSPIWNDSKHCPTVIFNAEPAQKNEANLYQMKSQCTEVPAGAGLYLWLHWLESSHPSPLRAFLIKGLGIFFWTSGVSVAAISPAVWDGEFWVPVTALAIKASCSELRNGGNWAISEGHCVDHVAVSCIRRLLSLSEVVPLSPALQYFPSWLCECVQWCPSTLKQLPVGEQTRTFPSLSPPPRSAMHSHHHHSRPKGRIFWSFLFKSW